ncbi:MAG: PEGA domain-containing protein [Pseudomonadota bacterium]|nr:PEGA domain-containing protein [Pseudomonadota bacterium]
MLRALMVLVLLSAAGCKTLGGGPSSTITLIESDPPGAQVTVEGFGECDTPCRIEIDKPRMVKVAKAGYLAQRFQIVPGKKRVDVKLELAAPTKNVDSSELPEL